MTIDIVLKLIRKELDISPETLARKLYESIITLNCLENCRAKPSRFAMIQIKDYCGPQSVTAKARSS